MERRLCHNGQHHLSNRLHGLISSWWVSTFKTRTLQQELFHQLIINDSLRLLYSAFQPSTCYISDVLHRVGVQTAYLGV